MKGGIAEAVLRHALSSAQYAYAMALTVGLSGLFRRVAFGMDVRHRRDCTYQNHQNVDFHDTPPNRLSPFMPRSGAISPTGLRRVT